MTTGTPSPSSPSSSSSSSPITRSNIFRPLSESVTSALKLFSNRSSVSRRSSVSSAASVVDVNPPGLEAVVVDKFEGALGKLSSPSSPSLPKRMSSVFKRSTEEGTTEMATRTATREKVANKLKIAETWMSVDNIHCGFEELMKQTDKGDVVIKQAKEAANHYPADPRPYFVLALLHAMEGNSDGFNEACVKGSTLCDDKNRHMFEELDKDAIASCIKSPQLSHTYKRVDTPSPTQSRTPSRSAGTSIDWKVTKDLYSIDDKGAVFGFQEFKLEDMDGARAKANAVLSENPRSLEAKYVLALCSVVTLGYEIGGDYNTALVDCQRVCDRLSTELMLSKQVSKEWYSRVDNLQSMLKNPEGVKAFSMTYSNEDNATLYVLKKATLRGEDTGLKLAEGYIKVYGKENALEHFQKDFASQKDEKVYLENWIAISNLSSM